MMLLLQVKRRLDWDSSGPTTGIANVVTGSNARIISIRSVTAAPFGQKTPSGQTTVISIPPSLRSSDQQLGSSGSSGNNKLCSMKSRTQVIQSSSVSITPVHMTDDHLFKTPIKPVSPVILTPSSRKRKVSGSSSTSSCSPRSSPQSSESGRSAASTIHMTSSGRSCSARPTYTFDSPSGKSKHRYETSLGQLTKKFITLLREAPSGVMTASFGPVLCPMPNHLSLVALDAEPE